MGDRANILLIDNDQGVGIYLYTHWEGSELPETLRKALIAGRPRWGDDAYLQRIITDQFFKSCRDEETGGGISTTAAGVPDGRERVITVDVRKRTVEFGEKTFSFVQYIALKSPSWPEFREPNYGEA